MVKYSWVMKILPNYYFIDNPIEVDVRPEFYSRWSEKHVKLL